MDKDIAYGNYMTYNIVQVTVSNLLFDREIVLLTLSERYVISDEVTIV